MTVMRAMDSRMGQLLFTFPLFFRDFFEIFSFPLNKTTNYSQDAAWNGVSHFTSAGRQLLVGFSFIVSICSKVLLDPPANVTATNAGKQGQLNVTWVPPPLKYMDDSMMYEVGYRAVHSHVMQV